MHIFVSEQGCPTTSPEGSHFTLVTYSTFSFFPQYTYIGPALVISVQHQYRNKVKVKVKVKVKLSLCVTNYALRHADVGGSEV
jgi:hypothetical protein